MNVTLAPGLVAILMMISAPPVRAAEAPKPGSGIHYLYLVRHGIYDRDPKADDVTANGLNPLGHEQARLIGRRLAGLRVRPASLVSSTYKRARETADDLGHALHLPVTVDSLLCECTPSADFKRNDGAEETALCDSSLERAWAKYMTPTPDADRTDVLVGHGNVIRWLVTRSIGADTRRWSALEIANGSLTIIAVRPDGSTSLVLHSDVGHLPVDKQTWTGKGPGWMSTPGH